MTVTSDTTTNSTDIDQFIKAVDNDAYAELLLDNGDTLVTDWEGDGYYLPYVVPAEGSLDDPTDTEIQQRKDEICECISDPRETVFLKRQAYKMLDLYELITTQHNDAVLLFFNE